MPPPPVPMHARHSSSIRQHVHPEPSSISISAKEQSIQLQRQRFTGDEQRSSIFLKSSKTPSYTAMDDDGVLSALNTDNSNASLSSHRSSSLHAASPYHFGLASLDNDAVPVPTADRIRTSQTDNLMASNRENQRNPWAQSTTDQPSLNPQMHRLYTNRAPSFPSSRPSTARRLQSGTFGRLATPGPGASSRFERESMPQPRKPEHLLKNTLNTLSFLQTPYSSGGSEIHVDHDGSSSQMDSRVGNFPSYSQAPRSRGPAYDRLGSSVIPNNHCNISQGLPTARAFRGRGSWPRLQNASSPKAQALSPPSSSATQGMFQKYAYNTQAARNSFTRPGTNVALNATFSQLGPLRQGIRSSRGLDSSRAYRNRQKLIR
jgi:hypothetical protein